MSAPPSLTPSAPTQLHARRCVRHSLREAAARCPGCGEFFCRECVVEHEGKLLCSGCLARVTAVRDLRQRRLGILRRGAVTTAGVLMLWWLFYGVGALLLKLPPDFHDGTVWKNAAGGSGD